MYRTILFAFVLIVSCSSYSQIDCKSKTDKIDTIYDSNLVHGWFTEIKDSPILEAQFSKSACTEPNRHDPEALDTILTFTSTRSEINIIATPYKRLLLESEIMDSDISLSNEIKIGMIKETVLNLLNSQSKSDSIVIKEEDGYGVFFQLFFEENRLVRIYVDTYVD